MANKTQTTGTEPENPFQVLNDLTTLEATNYTELKEEIEDTEFVFDSVMEKSLVCEAFFDALKPTMWNKTFNLLATTPALLWDEDGEITGEINKGAF